MDDLPPLTRAGEQVLAAAGELFYRDGIHAVGVASVAAAAGVTKKTLYDCFGSKETLVVHYLRRRHDRWWAHLEDVLAAAPAPRALAVFDAYLGGPGIDTARGCAFLRAAAELPPGHPGRAVIRAHKDLVRARLTALVREDRPEADDAAAELGETLFLLLEGATAQRGLSDAGTGTGPGADHTAAARRLARFHLDAADP